MELKKGQFVTLKEDFLPEDEHWEPGYWHLKKGTKVKILGLPEKDDTILIGYIEASFYIDINLLNIKPTWNDYLNNIKLSQKNIILH